VKAALACLLLAPSPPLLFMGEEFSAATPFLFFCDFGTDLASKVTEGRRSEFARFAQFSSPEAQAHIPDPNSEKTFFASKLDWSSLEGAQHRDWLDFYRELLACRQNEIIPRIPNIVPGKASFRVIGERAISVTWPFVGGGRLGLLANFSGSKIGITEEPQGRLLYNTPCHAAQVHQLAAFSAAWWLDE
jgi:1,4-alpha-glucan branching enzyme